MVYRFVSAQILYIAVTLHSGKEEKKQAKGEQKRQGESRIKTTSLITVTNLFQAVL